MSPQKFIFRHAGHDEMEKPFNLCNIRASMLFNSLAKAPRRKVFYGTQISADSRRFQNSC